MPETVIDTVAAAARAGSAIPGGAFPASHRATAIMTGCREAVADLVGGEPAGVILGPNMTTLTYRLAGTLADTWSPGDEIVVSRLDHDANVRPWLQAAARAGVTVRWAEVDISTGELPAQQYATLLSANGPGWSRSRRPATSSAPGPTWLRSPPSRTRSAR